MSGSVTRSQVNLLVKSLLEFGVKSAALRVNNGDAADALKRLTIDLPLRLSIGEEGLYFRIDGSWDASGNPIYTTEAFPGHGTARALNRTHKDWDSLVNQFRVWSKSVAIELAEPDPWTLLQQGSTLLNDIPTDYAAEGFSAHEIVVIHRALEDIKQFLIFEAQPTQQQLASINEKLDFLEESAKTQDKKGWAYTAIGVVFTLGAALTLTPEQGHKLLELTSELLRTIFTKLLT
jgi:hypothetical protein